MSKAALWRIGEICAATGGHASGCPSVRLDGVSIDSRTVRRGDVFVAIRGERNDGHDYVVDAFERGAGLAVVSRKSAAMRRAGPLVTVADTLKALQAMARAARQRTKACIIAVTGSVGKTTTKEALALCLSTCGPTTASAASYNNLWGVPLSLARMPTQDRFGVFEVGMNHPGEITPLAGMLRPHIAIVTAIEPSHIGFFRDLDAIAEAKAEIFAGLELGGVAILNRDTPYFDYLKTVAATAGAERIIGFGLDDCADARVERMVLNESWSTVTANIMKTPVTYKLGVPGRHLVVNSVAVLAACVVAGADLAHAALALRDLRALKGRGNRIILDLAGGAITLIDESYNANPASMRAALAVLGKTRPARGGRRIAVFGDMLELGDKAPRFHKELAAPIAACDIDLVHACGSHMVHLWDALEPRRRGVYTQTPDALYKPLRARFKPGDVVMIKGSLGSGMGRLVDALCRTFGQSPLSENANI